MNCNTELCNDSRMLFGVTIEFCLLDNHLRMLFHSMHD